MKANLQKQKSEKPNKYSQLEKSALVNLYYKGEKVISLRELSEQISTEILKIPYATLCVWLNKGYSVEEVIKLVKEARGISSNKANINVTNDSSSLKIIRRRKTNNQLVYKGVKYKSGKELCDQLKISYDSFCARKRKGWSLEECIGGKIKFEGFHYKSYKELCKKYGVSLKNFLRRKESGWSLEDCIYKKEKIKKTYFYNSKEYNAIHQIAEDYGMKVTVLQGRLNAGYSLKDAIEGNLVGENGRKPGGAHPVQFNGKHYRSKRELCRQYDVSYSSFIRRSKLGFSIEECLFGEKNIEFEGVVYSSYSELVSAYKLNESDFNANRIKGWTLHECVYGKE